MQDTQSLSIPSSSKIKILLIDDDEDEYVLVTNLLLSESAPFELIWAERLERGMESLAANRVDIVLLDLFLPDSRGLESFGLLKARQPNVPIVILSGLEDEESALEAVQKGAQDFLVK